MAEKKASDIVEQYTGPFARGPESISGDADHMRIVVLYEDGEKKEIFRGNKFNMAVFEKRMKDYDEVSILDRIEKTRDSYIIISREAAKKKSELCKN